MGVPEVWRWSDRGLEFLHLQAHNHDQPTYQPDDRSRAFPSLLVADAARFLNQGLGADKSAWVRTFRAHVREQLLPRARPEPDVAG